MEGELILMTENEFDEKFTLEKNHINDNAPFNGCMFETYGKEMDYIKTIPGNRIVTILDAGDTLYYSSGFRYVNRLGYLVLDVAYEGPDFEVLIDSV